MKLIVNVECWSWLFLDFLYTYVSTVVSQFTIAPFPQNGWTAVLLAARFGHKDLVQELCETFGADFLHRMKVRTMQTVSAREWLNELYLYPVIIVWLHPQDDCQPAVVHEVAVSASGTAVCVGAHWVIIRMTWYELVWHGCHLSSAWRYASFIIIHGVHTLTT